MAEGLKIELNGCVARLVLSRPDVHNAFNAELIAEIHKALNELRDRKEVRVLILQGAGKNFCAGADLNWMRSSVNFGRKENEDDARKMHAMLHALYSFPRPTIAQVHGVAFGGGVGLLSCTDIVVAARSTRLCLSEAKLGILPAVISPFVIRKIGVSNFKAYALSAKVIPADESQRIGFVQEVVDESELDAAVHRWVDLVLENGPEALKAIKSLVEETYGKSIPDASQRTVETIARLRTSDEGQEGINAFLAKRKPSWRSERS